MTIYTIATLNVISNTSVIPIDSAVTNGGIVSKNPLCCALANQ